MHLDTIDELPLSSSAYNQTGDNIKSNQTKSDAVPSKEYAHADVSVEASGYPDEASACATVPLHQAQKLGLSVSPVPGACAAIAALSVAGLPSHQFHFVGFLPAKHAARVTALEALKRQRATLIFYEAPHRLQDSVEDMLAVRYSDFA